MIYGGYLEGTRDIIVHHITGTESVHTEKIFIPYVGKATFELPDGRARVVCEYSGSVDIDGTAWEAKAKTRTDNIGTQMSLSIDR